MGKIDKKSIIGYPPRLGGSTYVGCGNFKRLEFPSLKPVPKVSDVEAD
jgi:hypothetical protein